MMNSTIKVMLLGGSGCGKTTLWSSMLFQFNEMSQHFVVSSTSLYLLNQFGYMMDDFQRFKGGVFLMSGTMHDSRQLHRESLGYALLEDRSRYNDIELFDMSLEDNIYVEEPQFAKDIDVFVIVIDTPYLMEAPNDVSNIVNCVGGVHDFLSSIFNDTNYERRGKMVMFVPVKCEKYVREGRIQKVLERIKVTYHPTIEMLCNYNRMNVCILPMETIGGVLFSEFKDPYFVTSTTERSKSLKCCKLSNSVVRLLDGSMYHLQEDDVLELDTSAIIPNTHILYPCAWYCTNPNTPCFYSPHNCEQLLLHILSFMTKNWDSIIGRNLYFFPPDKGWGVPVSKMKRVMSQIEQEGLIKNGVEGIEYLRKDL